MTISNLSTQRAERPALRLGLGAWQTGRVYADFVVDDSSLSVAVRKRGDLISRLGWGSLEWQDGSIATLLLQSPPDFPWGGGRTALYVCPACGNLQCGAVTAVIERESDEVIWRDFGYETGLDIDSPELDTKELRQLGPFRFRWPTYEAAIRSGYGLDGFNATGTKPAGLFARWAHSFTKLRR